MNTYFCNFPPFCKSTFNFPLIMVLQKLVQCISRGCWYTNMSQHPPHLQLNLLLSIRLGFKFISSMNQHANKQGHDVLCDPWRKMISFWLAVVGKMNQSGWMSRGSDYPFLLDHPPPSPLTRPLHQPANTICICILICICWYVYLYSAQICIRLDQWSMITHPGHSPSHYITQYYLYPNTICIVLSVFVSDEG